MFLRFIKLLISLVVALADRLSNIFRYLLNSKPTTEYVIIYYHAIRAGTRRQFASQMEMLLRLTVPIDIDSKERMPNGHRYSVVTFDDAFMSIIENALPELRTRKIPCTIFVPTGSIGGSPSWLAPPHQDAGEIVASAKVLRTIANQPLVRIGSHSVSHPDFRRLDDAEAKIELVKSKATLEAIIGQEVKLFSFPHGACTQRNLDLARESGYVHAFTIDPIPMKNPHSGFAIGRVRVEPHDWPIEFRLKIIGAYRWMSPASILKRWLLSIMHDGEAHISQSHSGR